MRPFKCDGMDCSCPGHIDTASHVPCCPIHAVPLVAASLGYGKCPVVAKRGRSIGGQVFERKACTEWPAAKWIWLHRDKFNAEDIPPWDGWAPVDLSFLGDPA